MNNEIFKKNLEIGQEKERDVLTYLYKNGVFHNSDAIVPLYQFGYDGKSPYCITGNEVKNISLPDIMILSSGETYFIEMKYKSRWCKYYHPITGEPYGFETGFNLYNWHKYLNLYDETKIDVIFYFLHEGEDDGLYYNKLSVLKEDGKRRTNKKNNYNLILFNKNDLIRVCPFDDVVKSE